MPEREPVGSLRDVADVENPSADPASSAIALTGVEWASVRATIVRYVERRGNSRDVAEDVAQECLVKLVAFLGTGRPASIYALAMRIAANALADRFRADRFAPLPENHEQACQAPLQDSTMEDREQVRLLMEAIDVMPRLRREVLVRRRIEGQSHARISADLELSAASVEKHVVRGLADLRKALEDCGTMGSARP